MDCCEKSKFRKYMNYVAVIIGVAILIAMLFSVTSCGEKTSTPSQVGESSKGGEVLYYTCGMHPSVRVSPEEYNKGNVNCPICNMKLIPVHKEAADGQEASAYYGCGMEGEEHIFSIEGAQLKNCPICGMPLKELSKEEVDRLRGVVSKVKIKGEQARRAGVKTEPVRKLHLYNEIRTVGKVAYDPQLAVAQEEFISSLKVLDKMQGGDIPEIKERARNLIKSSKRKLRLLGLGEEQIKKLEEIREVHTSLILPEKKMWIYGNVYEYELSWVKVGDKAEVGVSSFPGEVFHGIVSSINPVLDPKTRSVRFRAEVDNPGLKLKPEMYVDVVIKGMYVSPKGEHMVLAIPKDAILDTGRRKIVWVDKENGEFEGRIIRIGPEATSTVNEKEGKFYPVINGLSEAERVVTKANFLIDSQSQISGVVSAAYGGALGADEKAAPPVHQH